MSKLIVVIFALVAFASNAASAADLTVADEQEQEALSGGAWPAGKNVPCAAGVVMSVHSRLEEPATGRRATFGSGVVVEFKLPTSPKFLNGQPLSAARVVHYDSDPTNKLMESEKVGDRLQVCFTGFPTPTHDPQTGKLICDPNVDPRGLMFRVYDYRHHAAYMGPDSQHSCGGA